MHPALSVIFFTTLAGAGQGLFLALYTGQLYSVFKLLPAQDSVHFYAIGGLIAVVLLVAGLASSFLHLGRPERAWRSATQWRTSWLSREVIVLPAFIVTVTAWSLVHYLGWNQVLYTFGENINIDLSLLLGWCRDFIVFYTFSLHRHDLCLYQDVAGMGDTSDGD